MSRNIGGWGTGRRLRAPAGEATRPTGARVRQTLFDILAPVVPGSRFLDAFAGGGGVGLEALSRGAHRVVFIDKDRSAIEAVRLNLALLATAAGAEVFQQDARVAIPALAARGERFDVVFLDPPYDSALYEEALALAAPALAEEGIVVAEHFHKRALPERIGGLVTRRSVRVGDHRLTFYRTAEVL
jgi:16S rRNA (guanine(966)-N(2))-methyltransferase RsmD